MSDLELCFIEICKHIFHDDVCIRFSKRGFCRNWTKAALEKLDAIISEYECIVEYEAREVEVSPCYLHTFVLIVLADKDEEIRFLMDGSGVLDHQPYFGREDVAPLYLMNSSLDQISRYRQLIVEMKMKK